QRGFARTVGAGIDIGAFESDFVPPTVVPPTTVRPSVVAVGSAPGTSPTVTLWNPTTNTSTTWPAFEVGFLGGVRAAAGVVNGQDIVAVAAGPGGFPLVRIMRASDGVFLSQFYAFGAGFTGGVNVALADLNGDGVPEVITGADAAPGGYPLVAVYDLY